MIQSKQRTTTTEMVWKKFNAMGTEIIITAQLMPEQLYLLDEAERVILDFEKRFSRFINNNELHRLNNCTGEEIEGSDMMVDILREAKRMHRETDGIFDPTIIGSLEQVGYDKTFADIRTNEKDGSGTVDREKVQKEFAVRPDMFELGIVGKHIIVPKGFRVDLGGIGKGYIVDLVGKTAFKDIENYWISAGGDLLISGNDSGKEGWRIGIQDPMLHRGEAFAIKTRGEKIGIATSGILKRRGKVGNFEWTHLIDPRTGLPVENDIVAVTMVSSTAERADVLAKTVLILGMEKGMEFIENREDSVCAIFFKNRPPMFSRGLLKYI